MSAVLVTAMAVSLAACSSAPAETEAPATTAAETEATEAEAPESTEAEAETEAAADGEQQEILVAAAASLQSVSYTHLDVYKRQVFTVTVYSVGSRSVKS